VEDFGEKNGYSILKREMDNDSTFIKNKNDKKIIRTRMCVDVI
jgi:hypothetical protein